MNSLKDTRPAPQQATHQRLILAYLAVAVAGMLFALLSWKIATLELRFTIALTAVITVIAMGMMSVKRLDDFLIYVFFFNIPFSGFGKWLFVQYEPVVAKGIAFGLAEILLFTAYATWFSRIFIARSQPLPKIGLIDALFGIVIVSQMISAIGAPNKTLAVYYIVYYFKFYLIYYYLSHKIERHHIVPIIGLLLLGILIESPLALFERLTGNVGIGRTKGDSSSHDFGNQYVVPELEQIRAEGTTSDSHTLGEYFAMILPLSLAFTLMPGISTMKRFLLGSLTLLGIGGLLVTFARAGWFSFFIAAVIVLSVAVFTWKQGQSILVMILLVFGISLVYPKAYEYAITRILNSPEVIMDARHDLNQTAINILDGRWLFGYGPGNMMEAIQRDPGFDVVGTDALPVHNAFLHLTVETGIFSAVAFFAIIFVGIRRAWAYRNHENVYLRGLSLAIATGLIAYLADGLTNPIFHELVTFALFWHYLALSAAIGRLASNARKTLSPCKQATHYD
jgi:O-antigen ligase